MLSIILIGTAGAQEPPAQPPPQPRRSAVTASSSTSQSKRARRTLDLVRLLDTRVRVVEFDSLPLVDVLAWFKQQGLTHVIVRWKAIERDGAIDRHTPITLSLQGATLGEVLDLVLEQASDNAVLDQQRLTYHIFNGLLKLSTREDFDRQLYTRAYVVEDLLYPLTINELLPYLQIGQQFAYVAELDPVVASGAVAQRPIIDVVDSGSFFGPGDPADGRPDFAAEREARLNQLIALIKTIQPLTWDGNGGRGTIATFSDKLVVTQTIEMHETIGGTFHTMQKLQQRPN